MNLSKVKIIKLKIIKNFKGDLLKYLSYKDRHFIKFGECYFSEIKKNQIKGWNYHKNNQCLITVPYGKVRFEFANNIKLKKKSITISKSNYSLIVVPPKIWFKFKSISKFSIVANIINEMHKKNETIKIPIQK